MCGFAYPDIVSKFQAFGYNVDKADIFAFARSVDSAVICAFARSLVVSESHALK